VGIVVVSAVLGGDSCKAHLFQQSLGIFQANQPQNKGQEAKSEHRPTGSVVT